MSKHENRRERVAKFLTGYFEYECRVDPDSPPFESGEVGRGGRMLISAKATEMGVKAKAQAVRLWHVTQVHGGSIARIALPRFVQWQTEHAGIWVTEDDLIFSYTALGVDGEGETKDTYVLDEEKLIIAPGRFTHRTAAGKKVTGSVHLERMESARAFKLAPHNCDIPRESEIKYNSPGSQDQSKKERPSTTGGNGPSFHGPVQIGGMQTGSGSSFDQKFRDQIHETKSSAPESIRNEIEAVLQAADGDNSLDATLKGIVKQAVEGLITELKSPRADKTPVTKCLDAIKGVLPTANAVVVLASKVKSLIG